MKAIAILINPCGEEFFDAYGPMTKDRAKATHFASAKIAHKAAMNRFGRTSLAFWEAERAASDAAFKEYKGWTYRVEEAKKESATRP